MRKFLILILFLMLNNALLAQAQKIKINTITIEGNSVDASSIRLNSGLSAGMEITGEDLQQSVKSLWALIKP